MTRGTQGTSSSGKAHSAWAVPTDPCPKARCLRRLFSLPAVSRCRPRAARGPGALGPGTVEPGSHTVRHPHQWQTGQFGGPVWETAWVCVSPLASKVAEGEPPLLLCVMGTQAPVGLQGDCTAAVTAYGLCVRPGKSLHSGGESGAPREGAPRGSGGRGQGEGRAQWPPGALHSPFSPSCPIQFRHGNIPGLGGPFLFPPFFFDHLFPSTPLPHSPTPPLLSASQESLPSRFLQAGLSRIFSQLFSSSSHFCFSFRPLSHPLFTLFGETARRKAVGCMSGPQGPSSR